MRAMCHARDVAEAVGTDEVAGAEIEHGAEALPSAWTLKASTAPRTKPAALPAWTLAKTSASG